VNKASSLIPCECDDRTFLVSLSSDLLKQTESEKSTFATALALFCALCDPAGWQTPSRLSTQANTIESYFFDHKHHSDLSALLWLCDCKVEKQSQVERNHVHVETSVLRFFDQG
jgi:hypothetical protein